MWFSHLTDGESVELCLRSMFPLLKERKINPNSRFREKVTVEVVGKVATIAVLRMLVDYNQIKSGCYSPILFENMTNGKK